MFELAVIGPLPGNRLGLVRQCTECRAAFAADAPPCTGFGPGCFAHRSPEPGSRAPKPPL